MADANVTGGRTPQRFCLEECDRVSVCELTGVERFVVWAVRWRASADAADSFADSCLQDSFEQAGLQATQPAFEGFMQIACSSRMECPAWQRLGCWRLNPLEAHVLHAIGCLQTGLLGEAWATLARVCSTCSAGRALQYLEIFADGIEQVGGRIERWRGLPPPRPAASGHPSPTDFREAPRSPPGRAFDP